MPDTSDNHFAPLLHCLPAEAIQTPLPEIIHLLEIKFADELYPVFQPNFRTPSPVARHSDTNWMKTANTVGVNIRTIQNFWNLIPYALTLPAAQNAIHILPIWEPGVVASLYGPVSWNINPAFFSTDMLEVFPHLDTVEKQLQVVINLLHLLGKAVGMDVVPHTDRYSEMALANPQYFEWLQRDDLEIVRHDAEVCQSVQNILFTFLQKNGPAVTNGVVPETENGLFGISEEERLLILFGSVHDYQGRLERRKMIISELYTAGLETVPATMGPPYRGLEVDPNPEAKVVDEDGRVWRDYRIIRPESFSRVFGPLARYKLYAVKDDNGDWALDFEQPNQAAWQYVCEHYRQIQDEFGFDFMRGDMSHVQMRPNGVPAQRDEYYDLLGAVKKTVLSEKPYFGYFAESFLAPPGEMAYGDECDHLEASFADSTLGDLQSEPVGTVKFVQTFRQYRDWLDTRDFAPNFTIMTADKDDPRFDGFYLRGNEIRYFIALFLHDMPSYMALGFETRDPHPQPAPNEHYTKLYVFSMPDGAKGTKGPYQWGQNTQLYERLVRQKELAEEIFSKIADQPVRWLLPVDQNGRQKVIAWTQAGMPEYVFVANLDTEDEQEEVNIAWPEGSWEVYFSTKNEILSAFTKMPEKTGIRLAAGEGFVFRKN